MHTIYVKVDGRVEVTDRVDPSWLDEDEHVRPYSSDDLPNDKRDVEGIVDMGCSLRDDPPGH